MSTSVGIHQAMTSVRGNRWADGPDAAQLLDTAAIDAAWLSAVDPHATDGPVGHFGKKVTNVPGNLTYRAHARVRHASKP